MIISRDNNLFHFKLSLIYWVQNQLKYPNNSLIKSPETLKRHSLNKLGGEAAVTAVTPQFYANIQADATVSNFFNGINMADQKQVSFILCAALGEPKALGGRNLKEVHANMEVTNAQFTTVIDLRSALTSAGVAVDLVEQTVAVAETVRGDFVTA